MSAAKRAPANQPAEPEVVPTEAKRNVRSNHKVVDSRPVIRIQIFGATDKGGFGEIYGDDQDNYWPDD